MASIPIVRERFAVHRPTWRFVGLFERFSALLLFVLALPVISVSAIAIWLLSRRTPFIAHKRLGWKGSVLWMLKLRTMWETVPPASHTGFLVEFIDDEEGPGRKQAEDARVPHGFARFCRHHSLDELPQFWHVIRGEMALIGPRPITPQEMRTYYGKAAEEVLSVKPGIAGLWQISGRSRLAYGERVRMDLEFVRDRSPRMYFRILLAAIAEIWTGANTW